MREHVRSLSAVLTLVLVLAGGFAAMADPDERAVEGTIKTYFLARQRVFLVKTGGQWKVSGVRPEGHQPR
ncbi:MAG: hypothetical protein KJ621_02530 [Proteobacteria bacterium]|nr:hypothetical protein [Pseudomonadota bacterium]MBU1741083.1 hypothetical protein [Pseudomonadota bacterium]